MSQTLKFLGRGSAFNVKEGNTSAFIKENNTLFLIDCGSNIFERIINKKLLEGVKNVYVAITHRHPDHVGSLGDLIFYCYYKLGIKVNLLETYDGLSEYLLLCGITRDKYEWFHDEIEELDISISALYAAHCSIFQNAYGDISEHYNEYDNPIELFECYSFLIRYRDKKLFYSGDCSSIDWYDYRINECDEFYVDCCLTNYDNNVHYNINKLYDDLYGEQGYEKHGYDNINLRDIHCMHFDCDETIVKACELGFDVVALYE